MTALFVTHNSADEDEFILCQDDQYEEMEFWWSFIAFSLSSLQIAQGSFKKCIYKWGFSQNLNKINLDFVIL